MLVLAWTRCCCVFVLLVAALRMGTSQKAEAGSKVNSIKLGLLEPTTPETNRSAIAVTKKGNHPAQMYPCSSDKECSVGSYCHSPQQAPSRCLTCRKRKKRCHRDAMCCPGNRCSNYICVPVSVSVLSPHISDLEDHNKLSSKDNNWKKGAKLNPSSLSSKPMRESPACAPRTARTATAAPVTSGPRSASRCCGWGRCAPGRGRKALTAWRSSSAATAPKASPARSGRTPRPPPHPGSTCASGYEGQLTPLGWTHPLPPQQTPPPCPPQPVEETTLNERRKLVAAMGGAWRGGVGTGLQPAFPVVVV
ncbi:hypothetical protein AGOR_G00190970 [Albula goreensis]|uniref:Dickkopf N-terminal cysteine-rich domain-containing protein n=1 Tax=Albula goreensis TaxID=1534307 RepID=A0A8T3CU35_9TELE|nr:hypothetical protein AGOR_G00190970 [Albula goreensis]